MAETDSLTDWLIAHPELIRTNTPPDVLAAHLLASLAAFEDSLLARSAHPFFRPGAPCLTKTQP